MLNLDTHVLLHALAGDLLPREKKILPLQPWGISAIVLWEISKLSALGRIEIDLDDGGLQTLMKSIQIWPLTWDICRTSTDLDFAGDPADELIAATSIVHKAPLVTRDGKIRQSKLVPLAV